MIKNVGFVPNGFRSYYLNRSQPPLLAHMVLSIYEKEQSDDLLKFFLPFLVKELEFWRQPTRTKYFSQIDLEGASRYCLTRYHSEWVSQRPESFKEDTETCKEMITMQSHATIEIKHHLEKELYRNIAAAAESGWDFSSRWFPPGGNLSQVRTCSILPADLNALLMRSEEIVAQICDTLKFHHMRDTYNALAMERRKAIEEVLWDDEAGRWRDVLAHGSMSKIVGFATTHAYASDWIPLWCGCTKDTKKIQKAVLSLESSRIVCAGGIAASSFESGQQWDWPNVWPPLQYFLAEGCAKYGGLHGIEFASQIVERFLHSSYVAWKEKGTLPEKLHCTLPGKMGGGGEYECVEGFGWTIGLVLHWLVNWPIHRARLGLAWITNPKSNDNTAITMYA